MIPMVPPCDRENKRGKPPSLPRHIEAVRKDA
jgi:hypothetical protein